MSEIIKQINVDGVDYDIVSESAERKIAELNEKVENLPSGGGDSLWSYHKEGDKLVCSEPQITLGTGCHIGKNPIQGNIDMARGTIIGTSVWIAEEVFIGTNCQARGKGAAWAYDATVVVNTGVIVYGNVKIGTETKITGEVEIGERVKIGNDIEMGTEIKIDGEVEIGKHVKIGTDTIIDGEARIGGIVKIGDVVEICEKVRIGSSIEIDYDDSGMIFKDTELHRVAYLPWTE